MGNDYLIVQGNKIKEEEYYNELYFNNIDDTDNNAYYPIHMISKIIEISIKKIYTIIKENDIKYFIFNGISYVIYEDIYQIIYPTHMSISYSAKNKIHLLISHLKKYDNNNSHKKYKSKKYNNQSKETKYYSAFNDYQIFKDIY